MVLLIRDSEPPPGIESGSVASRGANDHCREAPKHLRGHSGPPKLPPDRNPSHTRERNLTQVKAKQERQSFLLAGRCHGDQVMWEVRVCAGVGETML